MKDANYPIIAFSSLAEWEEWLEKNHTIVTGIWMKIAKKNSQTKTITYHEALPIALCYGWIDGQANTFDEHFYLIKFTPRGPKSIWSKRNVGIVEQLIKEGKMKTSGMAAIDAAKKDGRWEQAYDSPKNMVIPEDFIQELQKNPQAYEFFQTLNKTNTYAIAWRLQTAKKPETRERRKQQLLAMLAEGKKLH